MQYGPAVADAYSGLMSSFNYAETAKYYYDLIGRPAEVIDLACGCGELAFELCRLGAELICVDSSVSMLCNARNRLEQAGHAALFVRQSLSKLDLYGTSGGAVCCLDSLNYLVRGGELKAAFGRLRHFLDPGALFAFDMRSPKYLASLHGKTAVSRSPNAYCVWEHSVSGDVCRYDVTLFAKTQSGLYSKSAERHFQRAYGTEELTAMLTECGFGGIAFYEGFTHTPYRGGDRMVCVARRS